MAPEPAAIDLDALRSAATLNADVIGHALVACCPSKRS
jgi:hypothetical protein